MTKNTVPVPREWLENLLKEVDAVIAQVNTSAIGGLYIGTFLAEASKARSFLKPKKVSKKK